MKSKADYDYKLLGNTLSIVDLNRGRMSVTNCIEDVVEEICEAHDLVPEKMIIVYQDTEGIWDGWDHKRKRFIALGGKSDITTMFKLIAEKMQKDLE